MITPLPELSDWTSDVLVFHRAGRISHHVLDSQNCHNNNNDNNNFFKNKLVSKMVDVASCCSDFKIKMDAAVTLVGLFLTLAVVVFVRVLMFIISPRGQSCPPTSSPVKMMVVLGSGKSDS